MRKKYAIEPLPEIELQFADGKSIVVIFNAMSFIHMNDEIFENGVDDFITETSAPELCAKLIYAGAVERTPDLTLEKAREIVAGMSLEVMMGVINDFNSSIIKENNQDLKETQKKTMLEFLQKHMK